MTSARISEVIHDGTIICIVVAEQGGKCKAKYGEILVKRLGTDLSARFGRGFGWRKLFQMRVFCHLACPDILQTLSEKLDTTGATRKSQTPSALSVMSKQTLLTRR